MDFSVIDKNSENEPQADFSVGSLLGVDDAPAPSTGPTTLSMQKSVEDVFSKIKKIHVPGDRSTLKDPCTVEPQPGEGFLKDLSRM